MYRFRVHRVRRVLPAPGPGDGREAAALPGLRAGGAVFTGICGRPGPVAFRSMRWPPLPPDDFGGLTGGAAEYGDQDGSVPFGDILQRRISSSRPMGEPESRGRRGRRPLLSESIIKRAIGRY